MWPSIFGWRKNITQFFSWIKLRPQPLLLKMNAPLIGEESRLPDPVNSGASRASGAPLLIEKKCKGIELIFDGPNVPIDASGFWLYVRRAPLHRKPNFSKTQKSYFSFSEKCFNPF